MNSEKPRLYFDSCCFIDLASVELGYPINKDGRDPHVWYCKAFLDAARSKDVEVSASTLAVTECTAVRDELNKRVMTDDVKRLFRGLLLSGKPVIPIQPTPRILEFARDLKWTHSLKIKPLDAIHVASAVDRGCTALVTTDGPLTDLAPALKQFNLSVCRADALADLLPDKYRQLPLEGRHGRDKGKKEAA